MPNKVRILSSSTHKPYLFFAFLWAVLIPIFVLHQNALAITELTPPAGFGHAYEENGLRLYTYDSSCAVVEPATTGGERVPESRSWTMFQRPRGIIIPSTATTITQTYIHFHGKNFTEAPYTDAGGQSKRGYLETVDSPTYNDLVYLFSNSVSGDREGAYDMSQLFQKVVQTYGNSVMFLPRLYQSGATAQEFTSNEFDCFFNEAKQKLSSISGISYSEGPITISGHSAGGNTIRQYLESGRIANTTLLFDACYDQWCKRAVQTNQGGNTFIYYKKGSDTDAPSNAAKTAASNRVKLVETTYSHAVVLSRCFEDHLSNNLCDGGTLIGENATEDLAIGSPCTNNEQCLTESCETSDLPAPNNKFCVCRNAQHCADRYDGGTDAEYWKCTAGEVVGVIQQDISHHLDYCQKNKPGEGIRNEMPAGFGSVGVTDALFDTEASIQSLNEIEQMTAKPQPRIEIPGLSFSDLKISTDPSGVTWLEIPYMGEYIAAIYKYLVIVGVIVIIVMFINFGLQWTQSGGGEGKQKAMKGMQRAMMGLILLLGSYIILWTINPNLVQFENLKVLYIRGKAIDPSDNVITDSDISDVQTSSIVQNTIDNVSDLKPKGQYNCTPQDISEVALSLASQGICLQSKTCALTASYILNRAGCKKLNGSPFTGSGSSVKLGPLTMQEMGWVKYNGDISKLSENELRNLPPGVLWKPLHHSALHLGNGVVVESSYSPTPYKQFWPKEVYSDLIKKIKFQGPTDPAIDEYLIARGICPISPSASKANPSVCKPCALLPQFDPSLGSSGDRNHYIFKSDPVERLKKFQDLYYNPKWLN